MKNQAHWIVRIFILASALGWLILTFAFAKPYLGFYSSLVFIVLVLYTFIRIKVFFSNSFVRDVKQACALSAASFIGLFALIEFAPICSFGFLYEEVITYLMLSAFIQFAIDCFCLFIILKGNNLLIKSVCSLLSALGVMIFLVTAFLAVHNGRFNLEADRLKYQCDFVDSANAIPREE